MGALTRWSRNYLCSHARSIWWTPPSDLGLVACNMQTLLCSTFCSGDIRIPRWEHENQGSAIPQSGKRSGKVYFWKAVIYVWQGQFCCDLPVAAAKPTQRRLFPFLTFKAFTAGFHFSPHLTSFLDSSLILPPPSSLSLHVPASSEGFSLTAIQQRWLLIRRLKCASAGFDASQVPQKRDGGFLIITIELWIDD